MKTNKPLQEKEKSPITRKTVIVGEPEQQNDEPPQNIIAMLFGIIICIIFFSVIVYKHVDENVPLNQKAPLALEKVIENVIEPAFEQASIESIESIEKNIIIINPTTPLDIFPPKKIETVKLQPKFSKYPNYHLYDPIILREAKRINARPTVIKAIIEQESHYRADVFKYESKWELAYGKNFTRGEKESLDSWRMNFSSIGLMQVGYALHKEFCNLNSWKDLKDPDKNITCGASLFERCRESGMSESQCIKAHNGSGPMAEKYKNEVINRMAKLIVVDSNLPS